MRGVVVATNGNATGDSGFETVVKSVVVESVVVESVVAANILKAHDITADSLRHVTGSNLSSSLSSTTHICEKTKVLFDLLTCFLRFEREMR